MSNVHQINSSKVSNLINGVAEDTTGSSHLTPSPHLSFQIDGITTATVDVEVSNDETTWSSILTATSDGGYVVSDNYFKHIRATVSGYSAGTIYVRMGS